MLEPGLWVGNANPETLCEATADEPCEPLVWVTDKVRFPIDEGDGGDRGGVVCLSWGSVPEEALGQLLREPGGRLYIYI